MKLQSVFIATLSAQPHIKYKLRYPLSYPTSERWTKGTQMMPNVRHDNLMKLNPMDGRIKISPSSNNVFYLFSYDIFVSLQLLIDRYIICALYGEKMAYKVTYKRMPPTKKFYISVSQDPQKSFYPMIVPVICMITFLLVIALITRKKRSGIKIMCHVMGARQLTYWLSWLLYGAVTASAITLVITCILFIFLECSFFALWVVLFLFFMAEYCLCFLLCVIFSNVYRQHADFEHYEKQLLTPLQADELALLAERLEKRYKVRSRAVRGVSFTVRSGECFGLLGHNGAGKSTSFGMLTGAHRLSATRLLFGHQIGHCPQHDALMPTFTGQEMANLMARLRRVPANEQKVRVNIWFELLEAEGMHMQTKTYSAGNKRKCNTALAMIGEPPILFLDEPTSGVDLWSRRKLWSAMKEIRRMEQSVVLTSHSMDECEALCDRLAIMAAGRLHCLGSIPHLKAKFRRGFTLRIRIRNAMAAEEMTMSIKRRFSPAKLTDQHGVMMEFRLANKDLKWSKLFYHMEKIRQKHRAIEDYTISDTTVEEIFLSIKH